MGCVFIASSLRKVQLKASTDISRQTADKKLIYFASKDVYKRSSLPIMPTNRKLESPDPIPFESPQVQREDVDPTRYNRFSAQVVLFSRWFLNALVIGVGDILVIAASLFLGGALRHYFKGDSMIPEWWWFLAGVWAISSLGVRLLPGWGLGPMEELRRTVLLLVGVFAGTTTALFLVKESVETSRLTLSISFLFCLVLLPTCRMFLKGRLIKMGLWGMQAVIYGNSRNIESLISSLQAESGLGYRPIAIFDEENQEGISELLGVPVLEPPTNGRVCADVAILAAEGLTRHELLVKLEGPLSSYKHVVIVPDLLEAPSLWVKPRDMGGVLGLEITFNLEDILSRLIKRSFELCAIFITLPITLPLCLILALGVWLQDRKSPFFFQERIGLGGRPFKIWKFRSMHANAERILEERLNQDESLRDEWNTHYKLKNDPRITFTGKFLRRFSLDELPQLINVLKGEMSLVGPRPLPQYHHDSLDNRVRNLREKLRPGMTGLWQVSGRSDTGNDGLKKWDSYYARNWSIWLDAVILVRTFKAVLKGGGAY